MSSVSSALKSLRSRDIALQEYASMRVVTRRVGVERLSARERMSSSAISRN